MEQQIEDLQTRYKMKESSEKQLKEQLRDSLHLFANGKKRQVNGFVNATVLIVV